MARCAHRQDYWAGNRRANFGLHARRLQLDCSTRRDTRAVRLDARDGELLNFLTLRRMGDDAVPNLIAHQKTIMPTIDSSTLQLSQPIEGNAPDTSLVISVDPTRPMATGTYLFQLEVLDNSGNKSAPAQIRVSVLDDQLPNAIVTGPSTVSFAQSFTLDGSRSTDIGGSIVKYIWTLLPQ